MMSATPDIATFNESLILAKLAALRILRDLMDSLADPDPPIPARYRELRLLACAILRTAPMKPDAADKHPSPPPRTNGHDAHAPVPPPSPSDPELPPPPPQQRFNPHQEWARAALRSLVAEGHLPKAFLAFSEAGASLPAPGKHASARPPPA
jgi:hypothetical protein